MKHFLISEHCCSVDITSDHPFADLSLAAPINSLNSSLFFKMTGRCSHPVFFSVDKERTDELLRAIQRKTVTLDTLRYNTLPLCISPSAPSTGETHKHIYSVCILKHACMEKKHVLMICSHLFLGDSSSTSLLCQSNGHLYPDSPSPSPPFLHKPKHLNRDTLKTSMASQVPRIPPPLAPHHEKTEFIKSQSNKKLQNGVASPQEKEPGLAQNGRNRPWERFTLEPLAQHFTNSTLQNKG